MRGEEIAIWLHDEIHGSCMDLMGLVDSAIEGGEFTKKEFDEHESFIYRYIDDHIFHCNTCGWWCEISEMADNDEWECESCEEENC